MKKLLILFFFLIILSGCNVTVNYIINVTLEPNGGILPENTSTSINDILKGETISLPIPTKNGYVFVGWYSKNSVDGIKYDDFTPITKSIKLYALWEEGDLSNVSLFLNSFKTKNYTLNTNTTMTVSYDDQINTSQSNSTFEISENNNVVYTHLFGLSDESFDYCELYFYGQVSRLFFSTKWFAINLEPKEYKPSLEFPYYNLDGFIKRTNENIYDFHLKSNFLNEIKNIFDFENMQLNYGKAYIDIDRQILKEEFKISFKYQNIDTILNMTREFTLSKVGTTNLELPLEVAKAAVREIVVNSSKCLSNFTIVTDESKTAFFEFINSLIKEIEESTDIYQLLKKNEDYRIAIYYYILEYKNISDTKIEVKEIMRKLENELSSTATNTSKTMLAEVLDRNLRIIDNSTSNEYIKINYLKFRTELLTAYEATDENGYQDSFVDFE